MIFCIRTTLLMAGGCLTLVVLTSLSCESPTHLREDFGVSYHEAVSAQTGPSSRQSLAGSTLDGRAAAHLYERYLDQHGEKTDGALRTGTGVAPFGLSLPQSGEGASPPLDPKP